MSDKYPAIVCTPGTCAGAPRLAGHRVNMFNVISFLQEWSIAEFIENYSDITEDSVLQVLRYCSSRECERDRPEHSCCGCRLRCINDGQTFDEYLSENVVVANPDGKKSLVEGAINFLGTMDEFWEDWEGREGWKLAKLAMERLTISCMPCCEQFKQSYSGQSPFSQIIALDFYDGALQGLAQCSQCGACYRFDTVDWNFKTGKRVAVLGALPRQGFEELVEFARTSEEPKWPFWLPFLKTKAPHGYDAKVNAILSLSKLPEMAVAWSGYCDEINSTRSIDQPTAAEFQQWTRRLGAKDWFGMLSVRE